MIQTGKGDRSLREIELGDRSLKGDRSARAERLKVTRFAKMNLLRFRLRKESPAGSSESLPAWQPPVDLPQGPVVLLMLIIARGGVKEVSCRFTYFAASAIPEAAQSRSLRASCSDRWFHTHTSGRPLSPSGCPQIRLRIPPSLPWRNNSGPAGRADLECRCMISHAASRSRRSARETPSDRSMRGYRHRSDGKATALRSCRADLAVFGDVMRLGRPASLRLCRSLLPLAFDLEKSNDMVGARREARASRAHPTSKLALVAYWWACFVRRKFSPHPASSQRYTRVQMLARDFEHRAASAGLFAMGGGKPHVPCAYGKHASRRQQQACVWNAACGGTCARYHSSGSERDNSPEWLPLAACRNAPGVSCMSSDLRAPGRPSATTVALSRT